MMSSALSFANTNSRRQIWSHQHPLRKQATLGSDSSAYLSRFHAGKHRVGLNNYRLGRSGQSGASWTSRTVSNNESSELSGYSASSGKKGSKLSNCRSSRKNQGENFHKQAKSEDKININIFLSNKLASTDSDVIASDIESLEAETECGIKKGKSKPSAKSDQPSSAASTTTQRTKPPSASSRQVQLQSNKENGALVAPISASPSLTIQRRPPLVRAMSAPVRPLDENSKNIFGNKRKSRRRKIGGRTSTCDKADDLSSDRDIFNNNNSCERDDKGNRKPLVRGRSALGCDIVTLVSLVSSEGSDSEKEDQNTTCKEGGVGSPQESPSKRAPFLRKSCKSENNHPGNFHGIKDFHHMLRRGSIAPLAARIRANRPPTAPPVSIYRTDFGRSDSTMAKPKQASQDDMSLTNKTSPNESQENARCNEDHDFPHYLRTKKERECWRLFQKMTKKGVTVSYDTILRGMLTPTEFRNMQKQREIEEAKVVEAEGEAPQQSG